MASGDPVVDILKAIPTATAFATFGVRAGGSTPAEGVEYWAFDASTDEHMDYLCVLRGYGGGGLTISLKWMAASATTGDVRLGAAIRRIADDAEDIDTSQTYDYNEVTATTASASGEVDYVDITFTNGADMDSLATNELFILRIRRNADDAADTMTGDAQLVAVTGRET